MSQALRLAKELVNRGLTLATAESCTGGGLSHLLTTIPGSSAFFIGGIIAYQNRIKSDFLGVPQQTLIQHGAVSAPTAAAMAEGCRDRFSTDIAVSITGIAGPGGGSSEKPVGLVFLAVSVDKHTNVVKYNFPGDREKVREAAISTALDLILGAITSQDVGAVES
ncbi:CinA family protein [Candidatus Bipolaricaulota bacterium]|nr:CinA family protein [Candidatus Bipolaricaulota bacterium]